MDNWGASEYLYVMPEAVAREMKKPTYKAGGADASRGNGVVSKKNRPKFYLLWFAVMSVPIWIGLGFLLICKSMAGM